MDQTEAQPKDYLEGVSLGLRTGVVGGALFAGLTLAVALVVGSVRFERGIGPVIPNVLLHLPGGALAGLFGGILHRKATSLPRFMAIGAAAFVPYFALVVWARVGPPVVWRPLDYGIVVVGACLFGGGLGRELWNRPRFRQAALQYREGLVPPSKYH